MPNINQQTAAMAASFKNALRAYRQELWCQRRVAIPALILPGLGNVLVIYIPALIIAALIRDFDGKIPSTWEETLPYIVFLGIAWLAGELLWRLAIFALNRADSRGMHNLYNAALQELLRKDMAFFGNNFAGSLTKKAIGYGRGFETFVDTIAFNVVGELIPLLFAVIVLWTIAPLLVAVLLGIILITLLLVTPQIRKRQHLVAVRETASNRMAGHVADVIGNMSAVQSFAHEEHEQRRHESYVGDYMRKTLRSWDFHVLRIEMIVAPMSVLANILGLMLAIAIADDAATTAAVFITFNYYAQSMRIMFEFNRIYRNIENSLTEASEFCALLAEAPSIQPAKDALPLTISRGEVVFQDVDFAYDGKQSNLLFKNFNLHIRPGEKLALVGHSGGGKTTITKLLLRFVDVSQGKLLIDGQDVANGTIASLRHSIAYVPQEPVMFHRSILENIRYGRLDATEDEVHKAARQAHAMEFIEQLPHGFDTMVGERGVKLSGGQRQRIAIARAILKDAPILVLDEATSALDSESELLIQDALWKLMQNRTTIVIAHRLSTIQKMDRIVVLDHGTIAEQGTHKGLITHTGIYAKLWSHQSGGFIKE